MARIRTIKPDFFKNEQVGSLPYEWRILFVGLWTQADREGRLRERVRYLKSELFPYDEVDVDVGLGSLERAGLIDRYVVDGQSLIAIPTFLEHQRPTKKEIASRLPARESSRVQTRPGPSLDCREGEGNGVQEQEGNKNVSAEPTRGSSPSAGSATFLEFPVVGAGCGGTAYGLSEAQVAEWVRLFPTIDVKQECRKALAWVLANSARRKTSRGMPKFLVGWLTRSTDNGRYAPSKPPGAIPRYAIWECPHVDRCSHRAMCDSKNLIGPAKYPVKAAS